jgi:hypothetical protein
MQAPTASRTESRFSGRQRRQAHLEVSGHACEFRTAAEMTHHAKGNQMRCYEDLKSLESKKKFEAAIRRGADKSNL